MVRRTVLEFYTPCNFSTTANARDFKFCTQVVHAKSWSCDECFLSGHGQGHVSNFYIVDLENFATASRRYTGDIHNSTVVGLFVTHCLQLDLQLHTIDLVRTCRISSFCTVAWQLAGFQLTRRIARSIGDS